MKTYKIKKGDTLSAIAERFGTSVTAIRMVNSERIKNVDEIEVGWTIIIPNTPKPSESVNAYYNQLGRAFERAMNDIGKLESVKSLLALLKD